jgi:hypothetical protein
MLYAQYNTIIQYNIYTYIQIYTPETQAEMSSAERNFFFLGGGNRWKEKKGNTVRVRPQPFSFFVFFFLCPFVLVLRGCLRFFSHSNVLGPGVILIRRRRRKLSR